MLQSANIRLVFSFLSANRQKRKIKKSKELAVESFSGSILTYVHAAPSTSTSNTTLQSVEHDVLDKTDDVERQCQDALIGRTNEREPDRQDKRQKGEDQHQGTYDEEKEREPDTKHLI